MNAPENSLRTTRICLWVVIAGLLISGITAFPLQYEIEWIARLLSIPQDARPEEFTGVRHWFAQVREGLQQTNFKYPFMAYGTDWLAFAHILLAVLFVGPLRDPVKNIWVIDFGIIACFGVIALALICGPIRGIPFAWTCIDCSFSVLAIVPLWIARQRTWTMTA